MRSEFNIFSMYSEHSDKTHPIEIKIRHINQLFNSMDPSPFLEKDLDSAAFEYLVSSVSEQSHKTKQKIVIYLPKKHHPKIYELEIRRAIHNFFEYKTELSQKRIKLKLREGRFSLLIGLTFLVTCILTREYMSSLTQTMFTYIVLEGLLISGWVAMWKPISDILYAWWPIHAEKKIYKKLSEMDIEFRYT